MRFFVYNVILHHIKLLQLENYNLGRFFSVIFARYVPRGATRADVTWTMKLVLVTGIAIAIQVGASWGLSSLPVLSFGGRAVLAVILFIILGYMFFIFLSVSTLLVRPIDQVARRFIVLQAKRKMKQLNDLTVIGITGSYGKTTMKETVGTLGGEAREVVTTEENKNTPLGIARTIRGRISESTDIFVVEMGAFQKGDIRELCQIATPNVSIMTGINEAHLERFGSLENTVEAKFEIVENAAPDAEVIINAGDTRVVGHVHEYLQSNQNLHYYSASNDTKCHYRIEGKTFHQDGSGISFDLFKNSDKIGYFKIPFLADYIIGNVIAGFIVAEVLDIDPTEIKSGVSKLTPAPHRLEPQVNRSGVVVIDDSYNGNPDGAEAAIEVLGKFEERRKIYVTPGLVEMGERTKEVHEMIGHQLADVADIVVLIETSAAEHIQVGLRAAGFDGQTVSVDSMEGAQGYLAGHLEKNDVVLFQNDWPENYI